jgi:hypothetical protein
MTQLDLIPQFDGTTFEPARDIERLTSQLIRVKELMLDGQWRSLPQIAAVVGGSEAGVSARLRDLRKPRNGAYTVNRRHVADGLHEYQVIA